LLSTPEALFLVQNALLILAERKDRTGKGGNEKEKRE